MAVPPTSKPLAAVYLAAGEGRRLRPLTDQLPKAMIEIGSKTLAERSLTTLREAGVGEIVAVAVAEQPLVLVVETLHDACAERPVDVARGRAHAHFEGLAYVAEIGRARERAVVAGEALAPQGRGRGALELTEDSGERRFVEVRNAPHERPHVIAANVGCEEPEGAEVTRIARDDRGAQAEHVDETAGEQRP